MDKFPPSLFLTATSPPPPSTFFVVFCCLLLSLLFCVWLAGLFFIYGVNRMNGQTENKKDSVARKRFATKGRKRQKTCAPSQLVEKNDKKSARLWGCGACLTRQFVCMNVYVCGGRAGNTALWGGRIPMCILFLTQQTIRQRK